MIRVVLTRVALLVASLPARAQESSMPPVELGGRVGGLGSIVGGTPIYGGVATVRLSRMFALEGDLALLPTIRFGGWTGTAGVYQASVRGRIAGTRRGVEWFWTAGGAGVFAESRISGQPVRLFGLTLADLPERTDRYLTAPVLPAGGSGLIVPFGRHAALRSDLRVVITPVGPTVHGLVGLSVPVGRFGVRQ